MIEKFSKEELEQIKRELGISDNKRKTIVCAEQNRELKEIWGERKRDCLKVCRGQDYIYKIIDKHNINADEIVVIVPMEIRQVTSVVLSRLMPSVKVVAREEIANGYTTEIYDRV